MSSDEKISQIQSNNWDLTPLYPNDQAWGKEFATLEPKTTTLRKFRGRLGDSATTVKEAFDLLFALQRHLEKLYTYAHLKSDEDTRNNNYQGLLQQVTALYARFSAEGSFITPELISLSDKTLAEYATHPELRSYQRIIKDALRSKAHTLSEKEEALLAEGIEIYGSAQQIFSQLNNADLEFEPVAIDNDEIPLTHGTFVNFLKNRDVAIRQVAHENYYRGFDRVKSTLSASLIANLKKDWYISRVRHFDSSLKRALFADNIESSVYDNLIETVSNNLKPLHDYYEFRRNHLKLSTQHIFDTYVPLVDQVEIKHSYQEAVAAVCDSMQILGNEYVEVLRNGLQTQRWVDVYESKGKKSGAYSSGCYDSYPYILMNFKEESLNDVFTLAHEAGHSMHSYFSRKHQPYHDSDYTIFVAEVASTFNEQFLTKFLRNKFKDDNILQAYLVNQQIDDIKATLFRQTMFAEFEREVHKLICNKQPVTLDVIRSIYSGLLTKYFGSAVTILERDSLECLRIPHFYSSFYVYKYATGLSAAISLSQQVQQSGDSTKYMSFLKSGCTKYPLELLNDAGVDMKSGKPIEESIALFARLVSELKELV